MAAIELKGGRAFRRELKAASTDTKWNNELSKSYKRVSGFVASRSAEYARGTGGQTAHFADSVMGRARNTGAYVTVKPNAATAFWGAKKRTGWNASNPNSRPQHPKWIGNSWSVGVLGQGPYAINPAIAHHMPEILEEFEKAIEDVTSRAFND